MARSIEPKTWTIADLVSSIDKQRVSLPRFQRAQVWNKGKQKNLIKSIANDFPIGCFLVYEDKKTDTCQLIDGLQRATAIYQYHKAPLEYIDFDDLMDRVELGEAIDSILVTCEETIDAVGCNGEEVLKAISSWLPDTDIYSSSEYDAQSLATRIVDHFAELELIESDETTRITAAFKISDAIRQSGFLDILKDNVSLDGYTFPVIFYSGDKKNLPDIFDRINVEGQKLSKYDILAASWYGDPTRVAILDKNLQHAIEQKYSTAQENGFEIEGLDHSDDDYTLFEYLFGLGKMIADNDKYNILFKGGKEDSAVESFVFTIVCIVYRLRLSELPKLPSTIKATSGTPANAPLHLEELTEALISSVEFINDTLKGYIGIELQKPFIAHAEYQICSYIARALVGKYDIGTWRIKDEWPADKKLLEAAIPEHYLYELITNFWGNAGDSKLFNNVWEGTSPSREYLTGYTKEQWQSALNTWFSANLKKKQKARSAIDPNDKVLLKYLYGPIATAAEEKGKFDIDHIYPVKLLITKINQLGNDAEGWPISAVGNLAFIQKGFNTRKGTQTLKEFYESFDDTSEDGKEKRSIIKRFYLVDDPSECDANDAWGHEEYIDFVRKRNAKLESLLLKRFGFDG